MSYKIPIGPYHPALEEPYKIEVECEGERVRDATLHIGFNFRGIEYLAQRKNYIQNIALFERVCGICSHVHTMTYCMAIEQLAQISVPRRASYIRVIMAELERLHSHILWAGIAAEIMGFETLFMTCFHFREVVMDMLEKISGNRVNYAMNSIGGVNRDICDPDDVMHAIQQLGKSLTETILPIFSENRTVRARCAGVGILTKEDAIQYGTVGPTARASGVSQDIRKAAIYAAYDELEFDIPVETSGDVWARIVVRVREMIESCSIIRQAITNLPNGDWKGKNFIEVPSGETTARIEAPRGEVFYYLNSDGSDKPCRIKVRTPSFANMPTVRLMVQGENLADVPLIQASIDPCYSCTDR